MTIAAIAVIIGSATWLIYWNKSQPKPGETVPNLTPLYCTSCSKAYAKMAGDLPTNCHFCKKPTAYRARQCAKCKAVVPFTKPYGYDDRKEAEPEKCIKCGDKRLMEVPPSAIEILPG